MLFSRKFFVALLATAVVGADKRDNPVGTIQFCKGDIYTHNYGDCAGGGVALDGECHPIKDGLFGQDLGLFNDEITRFYVLRADFYCNVYENEDCGGDWTTVFNSNSKLGKYSNIVSAFRCYQY